MRTNLPVTSNEYLLSDDDIIVTKTDLKGRITYVNRDFLRISGFSEQEALRAPHNIVRHPDMPPEAFEDLWNTLKCGKSWTGIVKNRCKNGDFYWVEANVAPILQYGLVVGFTSIRTKPSREKVMASEAIYSAIRAGSREYGIREGAAVKRGILGKIQAIRTASLKTSMQVYTAILAGLFIIGAFACAGLLPSLPRNLAAGACFLGAVLALAFCHRSYRNITFALDLVRQNIDRMSAGDLSGHIPSRGNDEIGHLVQSLRILQTNVKLLVGQIKESAEVVNIGSREIASGNADLSERTESQASSLEETASSMEELTSTVRNNTENAREANVTVARAAQIAVTSGATVMHMVGMMEAINESARKISEIVGLIDGIAFQTNLLALNAAVEAARAGEQGRGFAVVASEVRNLAQRSATAARQIQTLIADSVEKVASGCRMASTAGQAMDDVVGAIKHAAAVMDDISRASVEQSAGIEQVNVAVTRMDEVTQQNAALVEQAAAASGSLQEQATRLVDLVQSFKLLGGSYATSNLASARTPANAGRILISA